MKRETKIEFGWCECLLCSETFFVRDGFDLIVCWKCGNSNPQNFLFEKDELDEYEPDDAPLSA